MYFDRVWKRAVPAVALVSLAAGSAHAAPTVVESGWQLIRTIKLSGVQSARYNPADKRAIYVGRRGTSSDGLYRIDAVGLEKKLASGSNVAALMVGPSGNIFFSEDYGGNIYRVKLNTSGRSTWVSGFHSGDDDPVGMAMAPTGYSGPVVSAGQALVVDRGAGGPDEIWRWSPTTV